MEWLELQKRQDDLLGGQDLILELDSLIFIRNHIDWFVCQSRGNERIEEVYLYPYEFSYDPDEGIDVSTQQHHLDDDDYDELILNWERVLQRPLTTSGTTTSGNGICARSAHASSRSAAPRCPTGRATANTNLCTTGVGHDHATRYQPKRPRRLYSNQYWSSRHTQLFLPSNTGHHG
jgi:hypothetical protein